MENVDRKIRVRLRQLLVELNLEGGVNRVPQALATNCDGVDVLRVWCSRRLRLQLCRNILGEAGVKGVKAVNGAGDAVEADAFQTDLANELGSLALVGATGGRRDTVEGL